MPPTLEAWDLAVPSLTARSRFYALEPIGIGTAFVESLSGYVERLAGAHAVSAGSLIGRELFGRPGVSRRGWHEVTAGLAPYSATRPTWICFPSSGPVRRTGYVVIRLTNSTPAHNSQAAGLLDFTFPDIENSLPSRWRYANGSTLHRPNQSDCKP